MRSKSLVPWSRSVHMHLDTHGRCCGAGGRGDSRPVVCLLKFVNSFAYAVFAICPDGNLAVTDSRNC